MKQNFLKTLVALITAVIIYILDTNQTGGYLNMSPKQRELYNGSPHVREVTEREKLLARAGSTSDLSGDDFLQPQPNEQMGSLYQARGDNEVTDEDEEET